MKTVVAWVAACAIMLFLSDMSFSGARQRALDALVKAYPDELEGHDAERIYWRDGTAMPVTDGLQGKSFEQMLTQATILDQFRLPYPRGVLRKPPAVNDDPGRFRNENFFLKMYGDCRKGQVRPNLVPLIWLPKTWGVTIWVTRINNIAKKLKVISTEIDALPASLKRAAYPISGVFSCRPVRDTGRLSMHAFAAAIDLNIKYSNYWLWSEKSAGTMSYRNRMPQEIVDIFEKYGFIWGGKWYHYDTMHFEYRPELLDVEPAASIK